MKMIREWIITIVAVMVFITFVEILIPNSNNKRYINVVVGLLIMIAILNPLFYLLRDKMDFEEKVLLTSNQMENTTMQNRVKEQEYLQKETVIELYKTQLNKEIENRVKNLWNYEVEKISLVVECEDDKNLGLLHQMDLTLKEFEMNQIKERQIEEVEIAVTMNKNNNTVGVDSIRIDNEEEMIKSDFSTYYNLAKDNINVYILKDK